MYVVLALYVPTDNEGQIVINKMHRTADFLTNTMVCQLLLVPAPALCAYPALESEPPQSSLPFSLPPDHRTKQISNVVPCDVARLRPVFQGRQLGFPGDSVRREGAGVRDRGAGDGRRLLPHQHRKSGTVRHLLHTVQRLRARISAR